MLQAAFCRDGGTAPHLPHARHCGSSLPGLCGFRRRPEDTEDYPQESWFNICILHQNRLAHQQNAKNCIREDYLARFLDLVLWGHEHECIKDAWVS